MWIFPARFWLSQKQDTFFFLCQMSITIQLICCNSTHLPFWNKRTIVISKSLQDIWVNCFLLHWCLIRSIVFQFNSRILFYHKLIRNFSYHFLLLSWKKIPFIRFCFYLVCCETMFQVSHFTCILFYRACNPFGHANINVIGNKWTKLSSIFHISEITKYLEIHGIQNGTLGEKLHDATLLFISWWTKDPGWGKQIPTFQ